MATAYEPYGPEAEPRGSLVPAALRAPFKARVWREFLYLMLSLPMALLTFCYAVTMLALGFGLLVTFLGIPVLGVALAGCRALGAVERARARGLLRLEVADPEPVRAVTRGSRKSGPFAWVGALLKSGTSWRHVLYSVIHLPWAIFAFAVSLALWVNAWVLVSYPLWQWVLPTYSDQQGIELFEVDGRGFFLDTPFEIAVTSVAGALLLVGTPFVIRGLTSVDRLLVSGLLGPSRLAERVWGLESDRGTVVDTAAADLRRIERDLHDGAQARLVALAMDLGLAKEKLQEDPEAAARMVDEAHGEVKLALQELRDLARGIHPAILTDRGLGPSLSALAARCTVPVTVTVDLPERPAAAIEGIAYFTVSELLQNISKHSGARTAAVDVWRSEDRVMLQVSDDGRGGADTRAGSGLAGLAERLDAVDGLLVVHSPAGGPTSVTAELPWRR
ncbi:two-component system sensor kinase [Streptomyces bingchenggensis BCW-1]|uniref:histidine kinase n=1 Tax=Streptomyces bingchenggensis (strain BCW-1) TaxID=749414 RepID=D7BQN2_STRBB|nr:sensor histidine kinase [Streptomyces bingchenggensis]ADI09249.1 two-component system sensor kinase [Streptomyces bingchenggensis BCW-1]